MTVFYFGHLFHLPKLSDQPYRGQKTLITINIFPANIFFPTIFSDTDHMIRKAKRRFATFLKAPEPKSRSTRLPLVVFLRQPESHTPVREGAWPTFWCRASTSRLVRRRLALLSLCQSSPNPASPFFWHFSLHGSSFSLLRPHGSSLPWPRPVCALGRLLLHLQSLFSFIWVQTYQVLLP